MGQFTPNGYIPETTQEIIDDINAIFVGIFGTAWNTNISSPNGQFVEKLANIAINNQNFMLLITNSLYNPNVATTVWLEAICALLGIEKDSASSSTAICTCAGSSGTIIPANTQISNTNGDLFVNPTSGIIGIGGTVDIEFQSVQTGAISVLSGTITTIVNQVYGWDTVTNATNGTIGQPIQTDNELRAIRTQLLATQASASIGSIASAVYALPNVTNVYPAENYTSSPLIVGGITLVPNSIYIAVVGGDPNAIAQVLYQKKCPGVNMNGNTTVNYTDPVWNYVFAATFQIAVPTAVQVNLTIGQSANLPANITTLIQNSLVANFIGEDTNAPSALPVQIGQLVNVSRFYPSLIALGASDILVCTIQTVVGGTPAVTLQLNVNLIATLTQANVIVTLVS